jgi:hypothetical protein
MMELMQLFSSEQAAVWFSSFVGGGLLRVVFIAFVTGFFHGVTKGPTQDKDVPKGKSYFWHDLRRLFKLAIGRNDVKDVPVVTNTENSKSSFVGRWKVYSVEDGEDKEGILKRSPKEEVVWDYEKIVVMMDQHLPLCYRNIPSSLDQTLLINMVTNHKIKNMNEFAEIFRKYMPQIIFESYKFSGAYGRPYYGSKARLMQRCLQMNSSLLQPSATPLSPHNLIELAHTYVPAFHWALIGEEFYSKEHTANQWQKLYTELSAAGCYNMETMAHVLQKYMPYAINHDWASIPKNAPKLRCYYTPIGMIRMCISAHQNNVSDQTLQQMAENNLTHQKNLAAKESATKV